MHRGWRRSALDEFDQDSVGAARMNERDAMAECSGARHIVNELKSSFSEVLECGFDVGDAVRDVMQPGAAALEKSRDRRIGARRLDEFEAAAGRSEKHDVDALRLHVLWSGTGSPRNEFEGRQGRRDRR